MMEEIEKYKTILSKYRRSGMLVIDEKTERVYITFIKDFLETIGRRFYELVEKSSVEHRKYLPRAIDDWLASKLDWSYGTKVIAGYAVLHFLNWTYDFDYTNKAVKHLSARGRPRVFQPYIFSDKQINMILETSRDMFNNYPNLAIGIHLGWECIMRASELVDTKLSDIDGNWVTVHGKKGSLTNSIKVSDYIIDMIHDVDRKEYVLEHGKRKYTPHGWEQKFERFCTKLFGRFFGNRTVSKSKSWRWHDFARHTRITKLFEQGYSMDDIQALARHKRRESTEIYRHLVEARRRFG